MRKAASSTWSSKARSNREGPRPRGHGRRRVVLARRHGKLTFLVIRDQFGDLQLFCEEATLGADRYAMLDDVDLGDIVGAHGE